MGTVIQDYVNKGYKNHSGFQIKYLDEQPIELLYKYSEYCLIKQWLRNKHNCHIYIMPEAYKTGINFNWQILFYEVNHDDCWGDKSTGMYGDNGEYPTYELALEAAITKSLTLIE